MSIRRCGSVATAVASTPVESASTSARSAVGSSCPAHSIDDEGRRAVDGNGGLLVEVRGNEGERGGLDDLQRVERVQTVAQRAGECDRGVDRCDGDHGRDDVFELRHEA